METLCDDITDANEATLSFALGMILYYMLVYKVPFSDLGGFDAGTWICEEIRPDIGCL